MTGHEWNEVVKTTTHTQQREREMYRERKRLVRCLCDLMNIAQRMFSNESDENFHDFFKLIY